MEEININPEVLTAEITVLNTLLQEKIVTSCMVNANKGKTAEQIEAILKEYTGLEENLNLLIQNTITFLENAKDSMIDVDEKSAEILGKMMEGVH